MWGPVTGKQWNIVPYRCQPRSMPVDSVTFAKGFKNFRAIKGNIVLKKGGGDQCKGVWVWYDEVIILGSPWGIKHPAITRMLTTIVSVRGFC